MPIAQLRSWKLLIPILFISCQTQGHLPIDTQEYVFHLRNGQAFMRVLQSDRELNFEGSFLRIDPRHRVMEMDVLMIQPRVPLEATDMRMVRLMRRSEPRTRCSYTIWVPGDTGEIIGDRPPNHLVKVAPHTWIRQNEFNVQFDRDP